MPTTVEIQGQPYTFENPPSAADIAAVTGSQQGPEVEPQGAWGSFFTALGHNIIPATGTAFGGIAGGAVGGLAGLETGPGAVATAVAGDIAGGTAGGAAAQGLQDWAIGPERAEQWKAQEAANQRAHPMASGMGALIPGILSSIGGGRRALRAALPEGRALSSIIREGGEGRQVAEAAFNQAVAASRAARVAEAAIGGSRMETAGTAEQEVRGLEPEHGLFGSAVRGAITMGPLGLIPHARGLLTAVLGKAPADAAILSLAGQMYDTATLGKPFDPMLVMEKAGEDLPGFMLMNAVTGLIHGYPAARDPILRESQKGRMPLYEEAEKTDDPVAKKEMLDAANKIGETEELYAKKITDEQSPEVPAPDLSQEPIPLYPAARERLSPIVPDEVPTEGDAHQAIELAAEHLGIDPADVEVINSGDDLRRLGEQAPEEHQKAMYNQLADGLDAGDTANQGFFFNGKIHIIPKNIGVHESDISPVESVFHILNHEDMHGLEEKLPPQLQNQWHELLDAVHPEDLETIFKDYPMLAGWETDPMLKRKLAGEFLAKELRKATVFPRTGLMAKVMAFLRKLWHSIFPQKRDQEPHIADLERMMQLMRAHRAAEKEVTPAEPKFSREQSEEDVVANHTFKIARNEILKDIESGTIPHGIRSFSDLHNYVDANEYVNDGEREDRRIGPLGKSLGWKSGDYANFTNGVISRLDNWLKSRHSNIEPRFSREEPTRREFFSNILRSNAKFIGRNAGREGFLSNLARFNQKLLLKSGTDAINRELMKGEQPPEEPRFAKKSEDPERMRRAGGTYETPWTAAGESKRVARIREQEEAENVDEWDSDLRAQQFFGGHSPWMRVRQRVQPMVEYSNDFLGGKDGKLAPVTTKNTKNNLKIARKLLGQRTYAHKFARRYIESRGENPDPDSMGIGADALGPILQAQLMDYAVRVMGATGDKRMFDLMEKYPNSVYISGPLTESGVGRALHARKFIMQDQEGVMGSLRKYQMGRDEAAEKQMASITKQPVDEALGKLESSIDSKKVANEAAKNALDEIGKTEEGKKIVEDLEKLETPTPEKQAEMDATQSAKDFKDVVDEISNHAGDLATQFKGHVDRLEVLQKYLEKLNKKDTKHALKPEEKSELLEGLETPKDVWDAFEKEKQAMGETINAIRDAQQRTQKGSGVSVATMGRAKKVLKGDEAAKALIKKIDDLGKTPPKARAKDPLRQVFDDQIKNPETKAVFRTKLEDQGVKDPKLQDRLIDLADQKTQERLTKKPKLKDTILDILSTPRGLQEDPEYRREAIENFLVDNGFTPEAAKEAAAHMEPIVAKHLADAREKAIDKAATELGADRPTIDALMHAVRAAVLDPKESVNSITRALAKLAGFKELPMEDFRRLAHLDEIIQNSLSLSEKAKAYGEMAEIVGRAKMPISFYQAICRTFVNSVLSGLSTIGLHITQPIFAAHTRLATEMIDIMALSPKVGPKETIKAIGQTIANFHRAMMRWLDAYRNGMGGVMSRKKIRTLDDLTSLKQMMNDSLQGLKTMQGGPLKMPVHLLKLAMASTDYAHKALLSGVEAGGRVMEDFLTQQASMKELLRHGYGFTGDAKGANLTIGNIVAQAQLEGQRVAIANADASPALTRQIQRDVTLNYLRLLTDQARQSHSAGQKLIDHLDTVADLRKQLEKAPVANQPAIQEKINVEQAAIDKARADQTWGAQTEKDTTQDVNFELGLRGPEKGAGWDVFNYLAEFATEAAQIARRRNELLGRMVTGFVSVPTRLIDRSLSFTPWGLLRVLRKMGKNSNELYTESMASSALIRQRMIEGVAGTALAMPILYSLIYGNDQDDPAYTGFRVTLAGPQDKNLRDVWKKQGNRTGAIEWVQNGKVRVAINYARGGPESLKVPLIAFGTIDDMRLNGTMKNGTALSNAGEFLKDGLSGGMKESAFFGLKNITEVVGLQEKSEKSVLANVAYTAGGFIPWSGFVRSLAKIATGPADMSSASAALKAQTPFASFGAHPSLNFLGDQTGESPADPFTKVSDRLAFAGIPIYLGVAPDSPDAHVYDLLSEKRHTPSAPSRAALERHNGMIPDETWYRFVEGRGKAIKGAIYLAYPALQGMGAREFEKAIAEIDKEANFETKKKLGLK